jgi:hypothetical protein
MTKAKVTNLHWDEKEHSVWEATLEVEHENGDVQMFVIPITRMTNRLGHDNSNTHNKRAGLRISSTSKRRRT